jgi:molybdenum cofactor synthesis domain-containing protein
MSSSQRASAAVITVSDSTACGQREDLSGPAVAKCLQDAGYEVVHRAVVPDEIARIQQAMSDAIAAGARLVLTTGGTGIALRDLTPEATTQFCERLLPGIPELMRREGAAQTPLAALSRGVCGTRGQSLILNLPGSPRGALDSLRIALPLVPHALALLAGETAHPENH